MLDCPLEKNKCHLLLEFMGAAMFYCSHGGRHLGLCWFGNIEFVVVSSICLRRELQKKILDISMIFATSKSFCPQIGSLNTCLSSWEVESSFLSDLRYLQALLLRMSKHYLHSHPAGSAWTSIHIIKLTDLYSCMYWGLKWTRRCSTHLKLLDYGFNKDSFFSEHFTANYRRLGV